MKRLVFVVFLTIALPAHAWWAYYPAEKACKQITNVQYGRIAGEAGANDCDDVLKDKPDMSVFFCKELRIVVVMGQTKEACEVAEGLAEGAGLSTGDPAKPPKKPHDSDKVPL